MSTRQKISIITPVYNEEDNIENIYSKVKELFQYMVDYEYEHIFTNNCSTDKTLEILKSIAIKDKNVKIISFSRNYGYQKSIWTGYCYSSGDAVIQLDADLQDPIELIPKMIDKWLNGYQVVYGIRKTRKENIIIKSLRNIYYKLLNYLSNNTFPLNVGDFRLVDKVIVKHLRKIKNQKIFLRGVIANLGYQQIGIEYDRQARIAGTTKFSFSQMIELALDGLIMVSDKLLKFTIYLGFFIMMLSVALVCYHIMLKFIDKNLPIGFATLASLISFFGGIQLFITGVLGEYISHIYLNTNKMPFVTIVETVNLEKEPEEI